MCLFERVCACTGLQPYYYWHLLVCLHACRGLQPQVLYPCVALPGAVCTNARRLHCTLPSCVHRRVCLGMKSICLGTFNMRHASYIVACTIEALQGMSLVQLAGQIVMQDAIAWQDLYCSFNCLHSGEAALKEAESAVLFKPPQQPATSGKPSTSSSGTEAGQESGPGLGASLGSGEGLPDDVKVWLSMGPVLLSINRWANCTA